MTPKKALNIGLSISMVGEAGFEPTKSETTDLQSVPFGRSGTLPKVITNILVVNLRKEIEFEYEKN